MDRLLAITGLVALLAASAAPRADAASFDCAKAASETEKAICSVPALSVLDEAVAQTFTELRDNFSTAGDGAKDPTLAAFIATQRDWLRDRNQCRTDIDCLTRQHEHRLASLQGEPDPDAATPIDRFLGSYEAGDADEETYGLTLLRGEGATVLALFNGASQNWTCAFSGIGTLDAKGGLVIAHRGTAGTGAISIRLLPTAEGVVSPQDQDHASEQYCGMGGSLAQDYRKTVSSAH
jgi:uncharacterized protein